MEKMKKRERRGEREFESASKEEERNREVPVDQCKSSGKKKKLS